MAHPLMTRVLSGDITLAEIDAYNAGVIRARVAAFDRSPCVQAGGRRACPSHCTHGLSAESDLRYAATLDTRNA